MSSNDEYDKDFLTRVDVRDLPRGFNFVLYSPARYARGWPCVASYEVMKIAAGYASYQILIRIKDKSHWTFPGFHETTQGLLYVAPKSVDDVVTEDIMQAEYEKNLEGLKANNRHFAFMCNMHGVLEPQGFLSRQISDDILSTSLKTYVGHYEDIVQLDAWGAFLACHAR